LNRRVRNCRQLDSDERGTLWTLGKTDPFIQVFPSAHIARPGNEEPSA
jgi:hypothetical protein